MKHLNFFLLFSILVTINPIFGQVKKGYLTNDGSWCWFSDPRAIIYNNNEVITGWVKSNGTVEAAKLDITSQKIETSELYYKLEKDDHNNPAFAMSSSGDVLALYTRHAFKDLFINTHSPSNEFEFNDVQLIHPFDEQELNKFPRETITYANPYRLENENNRIYCFGRWTGFKPNIMWSDDNAKSWSKSKVFITNYPFKQNNRPYVKYYSDGKSRIHIVFTDGHPRVEPTNSVYYIYYENGAFYKAGGKMICTIENLPLEPKDASLVYKSSPENGRAWIADIGQDEKGNPVILYTKSPQKNNHEYWYASLSSTEWINKKICDSGKWFPQTPEGKKEPEPHYFGGMTIHPNNANIIYLSREINNTFEIERWETTDKGSTWKTEAITNNSAYDNVRPYIPRGTSKKSKEIVLWMENQKYIHYTNFRTSIMYHIRP